LLAGMARSTAAACARRSLPLDGSRLVSARSTCRRHPRSQGLRAPELAIEVVATDRVVDVVGEGFDVALRTGRVVDSSLVARARRSITVVVAGRFTANSQELAREAALAGLGIVNLAPFVVEDDVRRGALVRLLPAWSVPAGELHILYPGQRLLSSSARAVIDVLVERL
jgi:DNA-binding transcriptional LysR family regulator